MSYDVAKFDKIKINKLTALYRLPNTWDWQVTVDINAAKDYSK